MTEAQAAEAAMKRVPKGKIEAVELEREKGKFLYSYDLKTPGKSGIDEVHIDAMTGKVIPARARDAGDGEEEEAADEAKEMKAKAKPKKALSATPAVTVCQAPRARSAAGRSVRRSSWLAQDCRDRQSNRVSVRGATQLRDDPPTCAP